MHQRRRKDELYSLQYPLTIMSENNLFTIVRWVAGRNDSSTMRLMFQALFFFIISYGLRALKTLIIFCKIMINKKLGQQCKFQKVWKIALLQKLELRVLSLHEIMKKNNAWNIRHLVNESFVPSVQWASVLYWRLSDFRTNSVNLVVGVLFGRYRFMAGKSLVLKCNK